MDQHEIWLTRLFNDNLAPAGNALLSLAHLPQSPRPWANFITMQFLVVAIIIVLFIFLRGRLSMDRPGGLQLAFEAVLDFYRKQTHQYLGDHGDPHLQIFGTLFIFILFSNLIGIIPGFESPTQVVYVPAGCAIFAFLYYNVQGLIEHRHRYIKQFLGPVWWLWVLMLPIEIASHLARPLSLTVRLFANMFASEKLTLVFISLTYFILPIPFMGLHIFVSLVQAYVFALLATVYVAGAVSHEAH